MATLAGPPGACCVKTVQHTGTPTGSIITIADLPTYVAYPPGGATDKYSKVIIFYADIFSPMYVNAQLLIDFFASEGFLVLAPDYFEGDPVFKHFDDEGFNFEGWLQTWIGTKLQRALQIIPPWLEAVRSQFGGPDTKFSAVGYCFGGPFVLQAVSSDWISAGATAHPVMLNEDHFRKAKKPILLSSAAGDPYFSLESRFKAEQILLETKLPYHLQVFASVDHGYALRGNMENAEERWAKEECAHAIINWFKQWSA